MAVTVSDQGTEVTRSLIPSGLELRRRKRLGAMLARAERDGARLQFWARSAALFAIALFFMVFSKWDTALGFTLSTLVFFFLLGLVSYRLVQRRRNPPWLGPAIGTLDIVLLTLLIVVDNPFGADPLPSAINLREGSSAFLLIFVCLGALTLSPRNPLWLGLSAAISWSAATFWVIAQPGAIVANGRRLDVPVAERLQLYFDPNFVDIIAQSANVVLILIVTGILAMVVSRSRKLADDYIIAERARINLARHFSPNMVDELASADEPFGPVRRQDIAVRIRRYRRLHQIFARTIRPRTCSSFCGSSTGAWSRWCSTMAAPSTTTSATASWRHSACRRRPTTTRHGRCAARRPWRHR